MRVCFISAAYPSNILLLFSFTWRKTTKLIFAPKDAHTEITSEFPTYTQMSAENNFYGEDDNDKLSRVREIERQKAQKSGTHDDSFAKEKRIAVVANTDDVYGKMQSVERTTKRRDERRHITSIYCVWKNMPAHAFLTCRRPPTLRK